MKMMIAIVQDEDSKRVIGKLMDAGYRVTKLSTTGGFLRSGNCTLMIGVEDEKLKGALDIIEDVCESRKQFIALPASGADNAGFATPFEVTVGGATVFVLDVDQFIRF